VVQTQDVCGYRLLSFNGARLRPKSQKRLLDQERTKKTTFANMHTRKRPEAEPEKEHGKK